MLAIVGVGRNIFRDKDPICNIFLKLRSNPLPNFFFSSKPDTKIIAITCNYRNRPLHPIVYTTSGTYVAACFSGHYKIFDKVATITQWMESSSTQYIQTTTHIEVQLMKQLTM